MSIKETLPNQMRNVVSHLFRDNYVVVVSLESGRVKMYKIINSKLVLKKTPISRGYYVTSINNKCVAIHRIVAEVYLGELPKGLVTNHLDGNKLNNSPHNLEYCTVSENILHSIRTGLHVIHHPENRANWKGGISYNRKEYVKAHRANNPDMYRKANRRYTQRKKGVSNEASK